MPIYIDLSQCKDVFEEDDDQVIERIFIAKIVSELRKQLKIMFELNTFKFLKHDTSKLAEFEYIENVLKYGIELKVSEKDKKEKVKIYSKDSVGGAISPKDVQLSANIEEEQEAITTQSIDKVSGVSVQTFLSTLGDIRKESKLDAIYIFIDEFSELSSDEQKKFSALLKKILGSKNNIFFKIGTITGRYDFGKNIIIGRDIFPISLDLNDFVERYGGIVSAMKTLEHFTLEVIEYRLKSFDLNLKFDDVFQGNKNEIISRITREAMGIPRTIGIILQQALIQSQIDNNEKISLNDINIGLRAAKKVYMQQFQGAVKKNIIAGYYMDIWNSILGKALAEKDKFKKEPRPASHFMIDPTRSKYLNVLCENFIIHLLEESRTSKYGGNYFLYAIDYDICRENNILYAEVKDEFTAARFIYDGELSKYDCYFLKDSIKSYRCKKCNIIYQENELAQIKVKRCFECDDKLEEIIHRDVPMSEGNYTEAEVKILGLIGTLTVKDAMSAVDIGECVGCSRQKVSNWCSKVLFKKGLINIEGRHGKNYYYDNTENDDQTST